MEHEVIVQVLLSTYNGEKYLREQLESVINQKKVKTKLLVRDDGSSDNTNDILDSVDEIEVIRGSNIGAGESFFELIRLAGNYEYYALCDQDDIWDEDKIFSAISMLKEYDNVPALYSSNTRLIDSNCKEIGIENKNPNTSFGSAIVKNYATGCTVVFNKKLMNEVKGKKPQKVTCHDWWLNLVCLSIGGVSIFDNSAHISYRQHGNNVEGSDRSYIKKTIKRFHKFKNPVHRRSIIAENLLLFYGSQMCESTRRVLEDFRDESTVELLKNKELKTNNRIDTFLFKACLVFHKA